MNDRNVQYRHSMGFTPAGCWYLRLINIIHKSIFLYQKIPQIPKSISMFFTIHVQKLNIEVSYLLCDCYSSFHLSQKLDKLLKNLFLYQVQRKDFL